MIFFVLINAVIISAADVLQSLVHLLVHGMRTHRSKYYCYVVYCYSYYMLFTYIFAARMLCVSFRSFRALNHLDILILVVSAIIHGMTLYFTHTQHNIAWTNTHNLLPPLPHAANSYIHNKQRVFNVCSTRIQCVLGMQMWLILEQQTPFKSSLSMHWQLRTMIDL